MTTAAHLRLLTTHARTAGRVSDGADAEAEPPRGAGGSEGQKARGRRAKRTAGTELKADAKRELPIADAADAVGEYHHEQRRARLVASAQAFARLEEVIRLVACAYRLRVNWLSDSLVTDPAVAPKAWPKDRPEAWSEAARSTIGPEAMELRTIAARLAPARQIALVVGDPERQILWISQRPLLQVLERVRTAHVPLERVCCPADLADLADDAILAAENTSRMTSPLSLSLSSRAQRLMRHCGPVGRALVAQSNAVLALAPRVADCPTRLRDCRYVLAAPTGFATLRNSTSLTSWAERLLCLSLGAAQDLDTLAAGADVGLAEWTLMGGSSRQTRQVRAPFFGV